MAATGTIAVTNNSKTITGTGTKFTTELAAADIIYTVIQGVNWSFIVDTISSDTSLTITAAYAGNAVSGQQFTAIPRMALTGITGQMAVDTARTIRGLNYDKANWQQILTGSGNVTVNVPDGSQYTGPSWLSLTKSLSLKPNLNNANVFTAQQEIDYGAFGRALILRNLSSNNSQSGQQNTSPALSMAVERYNNGLANGADLYFSEVVDSSNRFYIKTTMWDTQRYWSFNQDGSATAGANWISNSDERIKTNIKLVESPLSKMTTIRGVTWDRLDGIPSGIGMIAQSIQRSFPKNVFTGGETTLNDGSKVDKVLSPDTLGVTAALHQEAILQLMSIQRKALLTLSDPSLSDEDKQSAIKELATLIPDESEYADQ